MVVTGYKQLENDRWTGFSCGTKLAQGRTEIEKNYFNRSVLPYMVMPYLKLFRRNLIEEHNIRFINISWGEDADFVLQYLKYCNSVKFIDYQGYINRIVPGTLSRKKVNNMWEMAQMVMQRCEDVFANRKTGWQFFYIRFVKCCLANSLNDWHEFKEWFSRHTAIDRENLTSTDLEEKYRYFSMERYAKKLVSKVANEYNAFIDEVKRRKPEEIIKAAYELVIKEQIKVFMAEVPQLIPEDKTDALMSSENTLNDIYEQWLKDDDFFDTDIEVIIEERQFKRR